MKTCPYCAEQIQDEAIKCRYCRRFMPGFEPPDAPPTSAPAWTPVPQVTGPVVGEGALRFSHSGERYVLGYGQGFFGIWDRTQPGGPTLTFPRTDDGWEQAWHRFTGWEPRAIAVPTGGTPPPDVRMRTGTYRSGRALAMWIVGLIVTVSLTSMLTVVFRAQYISLAHREQRTHDVTFVEGRDAVDRINAIVIVSGAVTLAAGIVWLIWQYRSQRNLMVLGAGGLKYRPGWTVGWWLIPFANFAMPYLTVRELYKASAPGAGAIDWAATRTSFLLSAWWGAWLGRIIVSVIAAAVAPRQDLTVALEATRQGWLIVGDVVTVVAAALAILVVREVDRRQEEKRSRQLAVVDGGWPGVAAR